MIEGGEKQLKSALMNYEERKVEENILQLKLKEAEKIISKVDDKLYDLEKYALQMEAVSVRVIFFFFFTFYDTFRVFRQCKKEELK